MPQLYVLNKSKLQLNTSHSSTQQTKKNTQKSKSTTHSYYSKTLNQISHAMQCDKVLALKFCFQRWQVCNKTFSSHAIYQLIHSATIFIRSHPCLPFHLFIELTSNHSHKPLRLSY